jgi:hypothetical protein
VASSGAEGPKGEILKSNVTDVEPETSQTRSGSRSPLPLLVAGLLLFVLGAGVALYWSTAQTRTQQVATAAAASTALSRTAAPAPGGAAPAETGSTADAAAAGPLAAVNGISCDTLEGTIVHIHAHLAIFVDGQEEQVPLGIGIGQPWQVTSSDEGPFVVDGSCFYWLHTHTEDGIIHVEAPVRRRFSLGDFFAIWGQPLSGNQVGPAQGQVIVYVNGQRESTNPQDVTILPHERIQLDVGTDVPPYQFEFPPGD